VYVLVCINNVRRNKHSFGKGFDKKQFLKGTKTNMGAQNLYVSRVGKRHVLSL